MILEAIVSRINEQLPEPHASLLAGMIFGVKTSMPEDFYNALLITGTVHMIALSGMNVSIIIRLLFDSASIWLGKRSSVIVTLIGIGGFLILVGPSPTIVRASLMGTLTILAVYMGRKNIPLFFLAVAAGVMAVFDPQVITNISFQLSFCATLGIILLGGSPYPSFDSDISTDKEVVSKQVVSPDQASKVFQYLRSLVKFLGGELRITLAAQLFTAPVILYKFQTLSVIAPVANIAVGWLVPVIMYGGLILVAISFIAKPLAYMVGLAVWVPLTIFIGVITFLSKVPIASIEF